MSKTPDKYERDYITGNLSFSLKPVALLLVAIVAFMASGIIFKRNEHKRHKENLEKAVDDAMRLHGKELATALKNVEITDFAIDEKSIPKKDCETDQGYSKRVFDSKQSIVELKSILRTYFISQDFSIRVFIRTKDNTYADVSYRDSRVYTPTNDRRNGELPYFGDQCVTLLLNNGKCDQNSNYNESPSSIRVISRGKSASLAYFYYKNSDY